MARQPKADEDVAQDGAIETAAQRLDRAVSLLESQVKTLSTRAAGAAGGLFDFDRSNLAAELDAARAHERELEAAGAEASQALGRAISGIRSALQQVEEG
jgi:hypothetical protein